MTNQELFLKDQKSLKALITKYEKGLEANPDDMKLKSKLRGLKVTVTRRANKHKQQLSSDTLQTKYDNTQLELAALLGDYQSLQEEHIALVDTQPDVDKLLAEHQELLNNHTIAVRIIGEMQQELDAAKVEIATATEWNQQLQYECSNMDTQLRMINNILIVAKHPPTHTQRKLN